jgi:hypothetical protein
MTFAVAGVLLAMLVLWLGGNSRRVNELTESHPTETSKKPPTSLMPPAAPVSDTSRYVPEPTSVRTEPSILTAITRQLLPDVEVPPWSDEMEGLILSHIARHAGLELTELQVQCAVSECVVFMGGRRVPVYQMGFDVFAHENGFSSARIHTMDGGPNRIVYLRR